MSCYLRPLPDGSSIQAWRIGNGVAVRLGVTNPEGGPGSYFKAEPGEKIWDAIRRQATSWFEPDGQNPFHKTTRQPGEFYPRMARPYDPHPDESPGRNPGAETDADFIAIARGQLTTLTRQLDRICQTVHPTERTFDAFGHDIRNLLILACTEAESHWRGVLVANGRTKDHYNTQDYVVLRDAMKLDEYAVAFPNYPWLTALRPYQGWGSTGKPTQDLKWYAAYNAVKHNRENEFEQATLRHAFEAVSACIIMMVAQFGLRDGLGQRSELQSFFHLSEVPAWPLSEVYVMPYGEPARLGDWAPVQFDFNNTAS